MEGLTLAEPMRAGEIVRIRTTGGGGWGDPLAREPAAVLRDVVDGKVSQHAAEHDYGVVLHTMDEAPSLLTTVHGNSESRLAVDVDATTALRARMRAGRGEPVFFDRGAGFPRLAAGATHAEVDTISAQERDAIERYEHHEPRAGAASGGRR